MGYKVPRAPKPVFLFESDDVRDVFVPLLGFDVVRHDNRAFVPVRVESIGKTFPARLITLEQFDELRPDEVGPACHSRRVALLQPMPDRQGQYGSRQTVIEFVYKGEFEPEIVLSEVSPQAGRGLFLEVNGEVSHVSLII